MLLVALGDPARFLAGVPSLGGLSFMQDAEGEPILARRGTRLGPKPAQQFGTDLAVLVLAQRVLQVLVALCGFPRGLVPGYRCRCLGGVAGPFACLACGVQQRNVAGAVRSLEADGHLVLGPLGETSDRSRFPVGLGGPRRPRGPLGNG